MHPIEVLVRKNLYLVVIHMEIYMGANYLGIGVKMVVQILEDREIELRFCISGTIPNSNNI